VPPFSISWFVLSLVSHLAGSLLTKRLQRNVVNDPLIMSSVHGRTAPTTNVSLLSEPSITGGAKRRLILPVAAKAKKSRKSKVVKHVQPAVDIFERAKVMIKDLVKKNRKNKFVFVWPIDWDANAESRASTYDFLQFQVDKLHEENDLCSGFEIPKEEDLAPGKFMQFFAEYLHADDPKKAPTCFVEFMVHCLCTSVQLALYGDVYAKNLSLSANDQHGGDKNVDSGDDEGDDGDEGDGDCDEDDERAEDMTEREDRHNRFEDILVRMGNLGDDLDDCAWHLINNNIQKLQSVEVREELMSRFCETIDEHLEG
jgi:hypothetical protein